MESPLKRGFLLKIKKLKKSGLYAGNPQYNFSFTC